jgi:hypothetical protein
MEDLGVNVHQLAGLFPQMLIFIGCIYYISKKSTLEGFLLFGGSLIGIFSNLYFLIVVSRMGYNHFVTNIIYTLGTIGSISFAIGFFLLIHKLVATKEEF